MKTMLLEKFDNKTATVGVVGLGYVGLPLLLCFVEKGFNSIGLDIDARKPKLKKGESYIKHIPATRIRSAAEYRTAGCHDRLRQVTRVRRGADRRSDTAESRTASRICRTSSTPARAIAPHMRRGQLIVLESTTYPGTTDEVMVPILEKSGLKVDKDFYVAFSPEREDPSRTDFTTATIPKVVGATSPEGLEVAEKVYHQVIVRHRAGLLDRCCGGDKDRGKHVPGGEHRAGERT